MDNNQLTDEQIEQIAESIDEFTKETPVDDLNVVANSEPEDGEMKKVKVLVDPNTGEHKILGATDEDDSKKETFEEMCERLNTEGVDIGIDDKPITEQELEDYIKNDNDSFIKDIITGDDELSNESIKTLLEIVNRRMNKEEFNIFRAYPKEVQDMITKYMVSAQISPLSKEGKTFRNMISEQILDEFITNITLDRSMNDFNKEIETLFEKGSQEISDTIVGYTEDRNKKYREYAESLNDEENKAKIINVLDSIDEAYNITKLKEFSKKCKIKHYDLENPDRAYKKFLEKYSNSNYNIYDIKMALPILYRNLNNNAEDEYTDKDINALFVCFCKQVLNMSPDNPLEHAYMYYFIYNVVLLDINKGEKKDVSDEFLNNIKECIKNLRERNNNFK